MCAEGRVVHKVRFVAVVLIVVIAARLTSVSKFLPVEHELVEEKSSPAARSNDSVPEFDCAVNWIRIPKTASSSLLYSFMLPLLNSSKLAALLLGPNDCVLGKGGCVPYWEEGNVSWSFAFPRYGARNSGQRSAGERCFISEKGAMSRCFEFDEETKTVDHHEPLSSLLGGQSPDWSETVAGYLGFAPNPFHHVPLDTSLLGWPLPRRAMVLSAFRDPLQRLLSAFHYGVFYGTGLPGTVSMCQLTPNHRARVSLALQNATLYNNYQDYQSLLTSYLANCQAANDNVYVQFLDPSTKNLSVALANLDQYVIVGLQSDLKTTMNRWFRILLTSCRNHPRLHQIKAQIQDSIAQHGDKLQNNHPLKLQNQLNISRLDNHLQILIKNLIIKDEIIYQRVLELYHHQSSWSQ